MAYDLKIETRPNEKDGKGNSTQPTDADWVVGILDKDGDYTPVAGFSDEAEARKHEKRVHNLMVSIAPRLEVDWHGVVIAANNAVLKELGGPEYEG